MPSRFEPVCVAEVEEREDEDEEEDAAVHAGPLQYVGCGEEKYDVDRGGVCSVSTSLVL